MSRFAVGIDLGTTNCALAFVNLMAGAGTPHVETFQVPQLVEVGELGRQPLLPSFAYLPGEHELPAGATALPWNATPAMLVGEAARRQGGRVPGRLVLSAKSWLCHPGVDRKADILPWNADEGVPKVSPVKASAAYLRHLREAWDHTYAVKDEANRLEKQRVVLTVPASFDEVARELTVAAAQEAGLANFTLLEEPQAAFYDWLHGSAKADALPVGTVCVVVDCGGGTTDFSLIAVAEHEGQAEFVRLAVGDHLLLGGDNMDIAVARHVEQQVTPNRRLDPAQWGNLVLACRRAKESALAHKGPEKQTITVMGRGSKVIGQTLRCELDRELVRKLALDGFLPHVEYSEDPSRSGRGGLQEFGLPYVSDPAITRHLASFLRQHAASIREASAPLGEDVDRPTAVLFNGGVFNADACRDRVLEEMARWYGADWKPRVLATGSLDLAVARGAAYAGWAKETGARRIRGGAARSYYVGIGADSDSGKQSVLCVVPHGLAEGEQLKLTKPPLELQLGEPVSFPLYTSTVRTKDKAGKVMEVAAGQLLELPALTTVLRGGKRAGKKTVGVRLETMLTEIGTLELHLAALEGENRWRLQLQARPQPTAVEPPPSSAQAVTESWSLEELDAAEKAIKAAYPPPSKVADPQLAVHLPKALEAALGMSRLEWPTPALRGMWEPIREVAARRAVTVEHEARWLNLAGFCLRPGWGDPVDPYRVEQIWKYIAKGPESATSDRIWCETWILCRRIAGGLDANRQKELAKRLLPQLLSGAKKPPRRAGTQEIVESWRVAASLERLPAANKVQLGNELTRQLQQKRPVPPYLFWSLARIGARVPLYGPINEVVPRFDVEAWIERLLAVTPDLALDASFALAQLARMSGDRGRDIDDGMRGQVVEHMHQAGASPHAIKGILEVTELETAEEGRLLGDAVPPGLRLAAT